MKSRFFAALACLAATAVFAEDDPNAVFSPELFAHLEPRMVGPHRGGRVTAVDGVPGEPFTFYMGSTGGGVWKTTNAGETWENVSDGHFTSASIGAVAVAPSDHNVVYAGTGSACPRGNVILGDGVYRSTDAGKTWKHVGLKRAGLIGAIRVHPKNPDHLWVAVLGQIFGASKERGVYRSRDGGATWERVLHVSAGTGAVDLVLDPGNPRRLFAAMWRAERKPWTLIDGGEESGLYRSTDGGDNWKKLAGGLPEGELGRIGVAVSPANPRRVWALVSARDGDGGLYRSDDGGDKWRKISSNRELQTRGWYYTHVHPDPADENTLYVSNARFWKSIDGGKTFSRIRTPHGDHHALWIDPDDPRILLQGNDGGATVSLDGGSTWSSIFNQPTAEFYRLTVDDGFPYRLYASQQDNSTISVPAWSEGGLSARGDWREVGPGESGHVAVHPEKPIVWSGNYIGGIFRHDLSTGDTRNVILYPQLADGLPPKDLVYRFQWNAPIRLSPHDPETLYHASNYVHRSRDGGSTWETISPDLSYDDETKQELPGGPIQHDDTGVEVFGAVFALEESPHVAGELWAGTDDGRVHVSRDGGESWVEVTPRGLERDTTVNAIEISAHRPGRVFIAAHRYRLDDHRPFVYRTDDGGESWDLLTDGANGIPANHPTRVVREDPEREGLLFAGTEYGLFASFDDGEHWQSFGEKMPVVQIADLAIRDGDLAIATHGRSFWVLDDLSPWRQMTAEIAAGDAHLFAPRPVPLVGSGGFSEDEEPDRRPTGALLHLLLAEPPEEAGRLEIRDAEGAALRSYRLAAKGRPDDEEDSDEETIEVETGINRLVWNFLTDERETLDDAVMSLGYTGGARVAPGDYQVFVELGGESWTRPLTIQPDPRLDHTPEDYRAGYELTAAVGDRLVEIHDAIEALRSVRRQLTSLVERLDEAGLEVEVKEPAEELEKALTEVEEALIQTKNEADQDPLNFPPKLDNHYAHLYGELAFTTGRPTAGSYQVFEDLNEKWAVHRDRLAALYAEDLTTINRKLSEAKVPAVLVPKTD